MYECMTDLQMCRDAGIIGGHPASYMYGTRMPYYNLSPLDYDTFNNNTLFNPYRCKRKKHDIKKWMLALLAVTSGVIINRKCPWIGKSVKCVASGLGSCVKWMFKK